MPGETSLKCTIYGLAASRARGSATRDPARPAARGWRPGGLTRARNPGERGRRYSRRNAVPAGSPASLFARSAASASARASSPSPRSSMARAIVLGETPFEASALAIALRPCFREETACSVSSSAKRSSSRRPTASSRDSSSSTSVRSKPARSSRSWSSRRLRARTASRPSARSCSGSGFFGSRARLKPVTAGPSRRKRRWARAPSPSSPEPALRRLHRRPRRRGSDRGRPRPAGRRPR